MGLRATVRDLGLATLLGQDYIVRGKPDVPLLMLTFDDGPHPEHTPRILAFLEGHGIAGTFFLIGEEAERHPAHVERIVSGGHSLGNHAYHHAGFARLPAAEQQGQIERTNAILQRHDHRPRHWFRPPQGAFSWGMVAMLRAQRQPVAMWSRDSLDYRMRGADAIVERFAAAPARNGDVILFHDDNLETLAALEMLVPRWRDQGFGFAAMPA